MFKGVWKLALCIIIPLIIVLLPPPDGLNVTAWQVFARYIGAILGLMLRPFPEPVVILIVL